MESHIKSYKITTNHIKLYLQIRTVNSTSSELHEAHIWHLSRNVDGESSGAMDGALSGNMNGPFFWKPWMEFPAKR